MRIQVQSIRPASFTQLKGISLCCWIGCHYSSRTQVHTTLQWNTHWGTGVYEDGRDCKMVTLLRLFSFAGQHKVVCRQVLKPAANIGCVEVDVSDIMTRLREARCYPESSFHSSHVLEQENLASLVQLSSLN